MELASAAGLELSLAVAVRGSLAGASTVAELVLGAGGAEATELVALAVEGGKLGAAAAFDGGVVSAVEEGVLLAVAATEPCVSVLTLALADSERDVDPRFARLEVLLVATALLEGAAFTAAGFSTGGGDAVAGVRPGAFWVAVPASAVAPLSGAVVAPLPAAGAGVSGAESPTCATFEDCVATGGAIFLSFML